MNFSFLPKDMPYIFQRLVVGELDRFFGEKSAKKTAEQQLDDIELFRHCLAVYKSIYFPELLDEYEKYLLYDQHF